MLRVQEGNFGFVDTYGARMRGIAQAGVRTDRPRRPGSFDLNGLTREDWEKLRRIHSPGRRALERHAGRRGAAQESNA